MPLQAEALPNPLTHIPYPPQFLNFLSSSGPPLGSRMDSRDTVTDTSICGGGTGLVEVWLHCITFFSEMKTQGESPVEEQGSLCLQADSVLGVGWSRNIRQQQQEKQKSWSVMGALCVC